MTLQIIPLDLSWSDSLLRFMSKYEHQGTFKLQAKRNLFLQSRLVLACVNENEILQAMFIELTPNLAITHGIFGQFERYTVDMLNVLCAYCSSPDPMIIKHEFRIHKEPYSKFKMFFKMSRLGSYMTELIETTDGFFAIIKYPNS